MFSFSAFAAAVEEPAAVRVAAAGADPGVLSLLLGFAILLGAVFGTATFDAAGVFAVAVRTPRVVASGTVLSGSSFPVASCLTATAFLRPFGGALTGMLPCFVDEEGSTSTSYESSSSPSWL